MELASSVKFHNYVSLTGTLNQQEKYREALSAGVFKPLGSLSPAVSA